MLLSINSLKICLLLLKVVDYTHVNFKKHDVFSAYRLVHCGKQLSLTSGMDVHIFSTRTGTKQGVESHTFRVETQRDQTTWSKALVNGAHQAAQIIQQVNCGKAEN